MTLPLRSKFYLRPHDESIDYASNVHRYYRDAKRLLPQLEAKCAQVHKAWPVPVDQPVRDAITNYSDLYDLLDERDRMSDSVRIYSAMAVEGFLNLYGMLRLGEEVFNEHFERLALCPKAQMLLLVCDDVKMEKKDPLLYSLNSVAQSRNALVHPKAKEVQSMPMSTPIPHSEVPDIAVNALKNMEMFFAEFVLAVPEAKHLVPKG
jgi:hypothetical protein